jgi:uncharacterized damage-inducible protein DinB
MMRRFRCSALSAFGAMIRRREHKGRTMDDKILRQALVNLLREGNAHVTVEQALKGLSPAKRGKRPSPKLHSVFEELEHMRIAQEDILRYTLDASWRSPEWPEGYWPDPGLKVTNAVWSRTLEGFRRDLEAVCSLARDPRRDLTARVPHGEGRTYLRQVLLVADHNAYHTAHILAIRRLLGDWKG